MSPKRSAKSDKASQGVLKEATLEAIADLIKSGKAKRITVLTGAGISTAAGIPDFRTKGTGLYDNLQKFNLPYPEAIFDIDFFHESPEPFYALAKEIYPGRYYPTKTHYFIRLLHNKKLLLRNFTQNIDTLERLTGLDEDMIVEAHGSFATASCVKCDVVVDMDELKLKVDQGQVARCKACNNLIKHDITFFGEALPQRFIDNLDHLSHTDLLIVIGTSLKVQPFASLIDRVDTHVPRLLINRELAGVGNRKTQGFDFEWKYGLNRDVAFLSDCDEGVERLCELLGWREELDELHRKGNAALKALWTVEDTVVAEDKEVDALANALEEKLTLPAEEEDADEKTDTDKQADTDKKTDAGKKKNTKSKKQGNM